MNLTYNLKYAEADMNLVEASYLVFQILCLLINVLSHEYQVSNISIIQEKMEKSRKVRNELISRSSSIPY